MSSDDAGRPMPENSSGPSGATSNQNREEATPSGAETAGHAPTEDGDTDTPVQQRSDSSAPDEPESGRRGGSGEGSQATGHPGNAG